MRQIALMQVQTLDGGGHSTAWTPLYTASGTLAHATQGVHACPLPYDRLDKGKPAPTVSQCSADALLSASRLSRILRSDDL